MPSKIPIDHEAISDFCKRHHVARLSLFGSVLREDFGPNSDIDFLVEFESDAKVTFFDLGRMTYELAEILHTDRRIDLRTPEDLSRYFRKEVLKIAEPQYVAA